MLLDENASYSFVLTDWLMLGVLWLVQEAFRKFIGQPVTIGCSSRTVSVSSATRFICFFFNGRIISSLYASCFHNMEPHRDPLDSHLTPDECTL